MVSNWRNAPLVPSTNLASKYADDLEEANSIPPHEVLFENSILDTYGDKWCLYRFPKGKNGISPEHRFTLTLMYSGHMANRQIIDFYRDAGLESEMTVMALKGDLYLVFDDESIAALVVMMQVEKE
jgi:hypothetical protein